jgi:hypothetical protein
MKADIAHYVLDIEKLSTLIFLIGTISMCFSQLIRIYFSQNTTNLLSIINVTTRFDA